MIGTIDALIVGADSRIGGDLYYHLKERHAVTGTSRRAHSKFRRFDLLYDGRDLPPAPITYFFASVTGFATCAADPDFARLVNVTNTVASAFKQVERGGRVVYLSSCAAETHPETVYGQLKLEAERGFLVFGDSAAIIRVGPVSLPSRSVYPDGPYHPIKPYRLTWELADLMVDWRPGIHRLLNSKEREAA